MTTPDQPRVQVRRAGHDRPPLRLVDDDGYAEAVVWPGMGARHRSLHRLCLGAGASTLEMCHESEAVYHVNSGAVSVVDEDADETHQLRTGSMVHISPGTTYRFFAQEETEIIGGPCPPDDTLYTHLAEPLR